MASFCNARASRFTAAFRDPHLTKSTSITRAVLIAFAIATIGFTALKYKAVDGALDLAMVNPLSIATAIGAFVFGIGMVIAGGCASGTLMRVGEGFTMQMLALLFFIIGSMLADSHKTFSDHQFSCQWNSSISPEHSRYGVSLGSGHSISRDRRVVFRRRTL
ncbi:MAG: YeeE/YedE family protein [Bacillus subtilis]|nr:YeeE/YedE family protein [Bacillus subtilis]